MNTDITFKQIVSDLYVDLKSDQAISDAINQRLGYEATSQPSIWRLRTGKTKCPSKWPVIGTLMAMHGQTTNNQQQGRAAA
jgi:hypothetical protein